ncbi:CDGSH iron-sulfur domain-containing protein [Rhodococcus maanshanensis]|uniref:CDGSH iron-sulfur domain-containing protein n=1 Tax=Rhodococcus maanshanensis TaxID=183556 RepID=UPI0022B4F494|nr:CDGSH iron-sulfur domain-containing protein [Rhodococcus maanshanensis]MCZ4554045.1 CDGSH iron-sulfur domain-containing protein [Rhodococcus maanshanensis]
MDSVPESDVAPLGEPAVTITVCPNGPLLVRGPAKLLDADGNPVPRHRKVVALCRCGRSGLAPFCDGTHKHRLLIRSRAKD